MPNENGAAIQRVREAAERHSLDSYTRAMTICRFVNSSRPAASQSKIAGTRHSGANRMGSPAWRNACVSDKSSLTEPFQNSSTLHCSKRSRRIAVPPPQQKLLSMLAEVGRRRRVPGRGQRAPESAGLLEKPAKRGDRPEIGVRQRRHQPRQPASSRAPIGIGKYENIESLRRPAGRPRADYSLFRRSPSGRPAITI